jgi:hypothetical protein
MASGAINGFQTTLKGSVNFTAGNEVSEVISVSFPELNVTDIDVTNMDSSSNYMEFIPGSTDPGTIELTVNYLEAQDALMSAIVGGTNAAEIWTITFPDSATWATSGYVSNFGAGEGTNNDKISRTFTIKCTGLPTHTTNA